MNQDTSGLESSFFEKDFKYKKLKDLFLKVVNCRQCGYKEKYNKPGENSEKTYYKLRQEDIVKFIRYKRDDNSIKVKLFDESMKKFDDRLSWEYIRKAGETKVNRKTDKVTFRTINSISIRVAFLSIAELTQTKIEVLVIEFFEYCEDGSLKIPSLFGSESKIKEIIENYDSGCADDSNELNKQISSKDDSAHLKLTSPPAIDNNDVYFGNRIINVLGRETEQEALRKFLACDKKFAWFQISGVAGQGKSRLALELVLEAKNKDWEAGFLSETEMQEKFGKWNHWIPRKPHLIVIDYVISVTEYVKELFATLARNSFDCPIRLLLLERQSWNQPAITRSVEMRKNNEFDAFKILDRAQWFLAITQRHDGNDKNIHECRFESSVLNLQALDSGELASITQEFIKQIPGSICGYSEKEIKAQLNRIDKQGRPLYAYLLAQEIAFGSNTSEWTREELLTATITREQRKWWRNVFQDNLPNSESNSVSMKLAVLSTIVNGLNCNDIPENTFVNNLDSDTRKKAIALTGGAYSEDFQGAPYYIPAMQPDILGEWFVISCLSRNISVKDISELAWKYNPGNTAGFIQRLSLDFPESPVLSDLLDNLDIDSISLDILSRFAFAVLLHLYNTNEPIPKNIVDALYQGASEQDIQSIAGIGWCYSEGLGVKQDYSEAFKWHLQAAQEGHIPSMNYVGLSYTHGAGVDIDFNLAFNWYSEAAKKGDLFAINNIGVCYELGQGAESNYKQAFELYQKAAMQGHVVAMHHLAKCYTFGRGTRTNPVEALKWYKNAAKEGDAPSMYNLGVCYMKGQGVPENPTEGVRWYLEAAKSGYVMAMHNLGVCYSKGLGVEINFDESIKWYKKSSEASCADSMFNLSLIYANGNGVSENFIEATDWCRKAAEHGHVEAMYILGVCYENGIGLDSSISSASLWYQLAADNGHPSAFQALKLLQQKYPFHTF